MLLIITLLAFLGKWLLLSFPAGLLMGRVLRSR